MNELSQKSKQFWKQNEAQFLLATKPSVATFQLTVNGPNQIFLEHQAYKFINFECRMQVEECKKMISVIRDISDKIRAYQTNMMDDAQKESKEEEKPSGLPFNLTSIKVYNVDDSINDTYPPLTYPDEEIKKLLVLLCKLARYMNVKPFKGT